ncbi:hypothetical protein G3A43_44515 [Paraburkholderia aspalathi]|uniref:hypothetical protein n=1 Tax=Paraburkholderia nemoris TaxID=2793076 RepID=UPI00190AB725|nr:MULTISPECIES: hypothetical protein [Paraburkholderia]MBK3787212.1 hypothetical protein [Paraburkholderia aspalathi]
MPGIGRKPAIPFLRSGFRCTKLASLPDKNAMQFERFHFALIGICMFLGAAVGGVLAGTNGAIGGMLAGALVGTMVAVSLLGTDTTE